MTQEEKAQRYDEAIETARKINSGEGVPTPPDWTICEVIFPELKESEDEKIRKALINVFATHKDYEIFFGVSVEDIRAWLESQGKHAITCSEEQMKVLDEVLNFAANHESSHWNDYIFGTLNNLIRQLKKLKG